MIIHSANNSDIDIGVAEVIYAGIASQLIEPSFLSFSTSYDGVNKTKNKISHNREKIMNENSVENNDTIFVINGTKA